MCDLLQLRRATGALVFALAFAATMLAAEGARGTVAAVSGGAVGLKLSAGYYNLGSKVELSFSTADGDVVSYGSWCIDNIREELLSASRDDRGYAITIRPVDARGQVNVGLGARVIPLEGTELVAWLERAGAAGCRGAQLRLAEHLQRGRDVAQDEGRALELVRRAAQDDHLEARYRLASMLDDRAMLSSSLDQAQKDAARSEAFQIRLALAEAGYARVYPRVGYDFLTGYGTKVDLAQAEKWYRMAAQQPEIGDTEPLTELATYLERLYGQPERAVALLRESARAGGKKAQAELQRRGVGW